MWILDIFRSKDDPPPTTATAPKAPVKPVEKESFLEHNITGPFGNLLIKAAILITVALIALLYIDRRIISK